MNINMLNYFVLATNEIFQELGFSTINITEKASPNNEEEIIASVGITGDLVGYLMLRATIATADIFVGKMLVNLGMESEENGFGQFKREALGEIVNQVTGRSIMKLSEDHIDCSITPPTIISGLHIAPAIYALENTLERQLVSKDLSIGLFVGIKKKA